MCFATSSFTFSAPPSFSSRTSPFISPMPSRRLTKLSASNGSKSSNASPEPAPHSPHPHLPVKMMGAPVAATAEMAPPPLALPSSLVMITLPIDTALLKALAWS